MKYIQRPTEIEIQSPPSLFNFNCGSRRDEILGSLRQLKDRREMEFLMDEYQRVWDIEPNSSHQEFLRAQELVKIAERFIELRSFFIRK
jgi:hypothetical protein